MNQTIKFAAVIGMGLALAPWAVAQASADQSATTPAAVAVIPPDQQPTKEQLMRLFEVIRVRQQVEAVLKAMLAMIQQQMQEQAKEIAERYPASFQSSPEQQAAVEKLLSQYMEKAAHIIDINDMLDDMAEIYQRHVSRSDVDAYIAFYSSPAGQHLLAAQPVIMQEYTPMVMKRTQERSKALTDQLVEDLEKLSKSPPPAATPAKDKSAQQ
jgi:hypothetical protein